VGAFVVGGNQAFFFAGMKPRAERLLSVDQIIEELRPKVMSVPGLFTFMQNPPPITVSGQNSAERLSAHAAERQPERDLHLGPATGGQDAAASGVCGRQHRHADLRPQVMVDMDRDRAQALGVTPVQIQDALYSAYGTREVSVIYAPADQYSVIMEVDPQYQRTPDALSKLYIRSSTGPLVPLDAVVKMRRQTGPLSINHFGNFRR
jgi:HAE1 family hydrophobic/amphiphilic exporter-1